MRAPLHRCTALPPGSAHASHSQNLLIFSSQNSAFVNARAVLDLRVWRAVVGGRIAQEQAGGELA